MNYQRSVFAPLMFGTLLLFSAAAPQAFASNAIVNGSFEADDFGSGSGGQRLGLIGNDVTGWFIPHGDGVYPWGLQNVNPYGAGPADSGNQWFVLGEVGSHVDYTIQQTVNGLKPGQTYTLKWAAASELGCCAVGELSFLSGSASGPFQFTAPGSGAYWTAWNHNAFNFVANASSVTFQFKDLAAEFGVGNDLGLDSVSLEVGAAVPEPGAWALMILGFGLVGASRRRPAARTA